MAVRQGRIDELESKLHHLEGFLSQKQEMIIELENKIKFFTISKESSYGLEEKVALLSTENMRLLGSLDSKKIEIEDLLKKISYLEIRLRETDNSRVELFFHNLISF